MQTTKIEGLFSSRTIRLLKMVNVNTLTELAQLTDGELLRTRGLGRKCLNEIKQTLWDNNLNTKNDKTKTESVITDKRLSELFSKTTERYLRKAGVIYTRDLIKREAHTVYLSYGISDNVIHEITNFLKEYFQEKSREWDNASLIRKEFKKRMEKLI